MLGAASSAAKGKHKMRQVTITQSDRARLLALDHIHDAIAIDVGRGGRAAGNTIVLNP